MDIAIVTGASSSLGLAISRRLIQLGFRVYGLGGDYRDCSLQNVNFRPIPCDLADSKALEDACLKILEKDKGVCLIVNNAKYFGTQPFGEMGVDEMERILRINLLCPLVLARVFGESLRTLQGYLIQLGAPFAESSNGGAVGAASAGGLKWMGEQLFNEYRDQGVKVCHLSPEPNRSRDARMRIRRGARPEASIDPEAIAQAIEQILQSPFGNVVTEMVIRPLRIDEPSQDPVRKIPYPEPQPIPYTVPREFIEAEEQLEEDEWKEQQQRKRKRRASRKAAKKKVEVEKPEKKADSDIPIKKEVAPEKDSEEKPVKPRRRARRKPKPPKVVVGFHDTDTVDKDPGQEPTRKEPQKKDDKEKLAKKRPPKKRSAKKHAKKSPAEEKPPKQSETAPAKKAVRKTAKKVLKKTANKKPAKKPDVTQNPDKPEKPAKKVVQTAKKQPAKKNAVKKAATKKVVKNVAKKATKKKVARNTTKRPKNENQTP